MGKLVRSNVNIFSAGAALVALTLVVGLFVEMVRSEQAHHEVTASALSDYAEVAAWQYVRRAEMDLQISLGPALGTLRDSDEQDINALHGLAVAAAERCPCPHGTRPDLTFRFDGDSFEFSGDKSLVDIDSLHSHLTAHRAEWTGSSTQLGLHFMSMNGQPAAVAHVLHQASPVVVSGYVARIGPVRSSLAAVFERHDLLPATLLDNKIQPDVLGLRVRGAGEVLFESGSLEGPWRGQAKFDDLTEMFSGLTVETALRSAASDLLLMGGTPRSRLPILATMAGLALLLGLLAAWQFLAERRLVRMRTDTIARISHELRTPLAQIRLFIETLRLGRARDGRERERALEVVDRESRRLDHLVNNVLRFGARERGGERLSPRTLALDVFLSEATAEFSPLADHNQVTLNVAVERPLKVKADPDALRWIVFNLFENATKYSPANAQVIVSAFECQSGHVRICVDDAGPGVPPDKREQIWDMYGRLDGNDAPGNGIGLALVRHYAELLGGRAWVEDAPGAVGTRFVVELPAGGGD